MKKVTCGDTTKLNYVGKVVVSAAPIPLTVRSGAALQSGLRRQRPCQRLPMSLPSPRAADYTPPLGQFAASARLSAFANNAWRGFFGVVHVSGDCSSFRPNQPPPRGPTQEISQFLVQSSRKSGTTPKQAQEVATRHEMKEWLWSKRKVFFF